MYNYTYIYIYICVLSTRPWSCAAGGAAPIIIITIGADYDHHLIPLSH